MAGCLYGARWSRREQGRQAGLSSRALPGLWFMYLFIQECWVERLVVVVVSKLSASLPRFFCSITWRLLIVFPFLSPTSLQNILFVVLTSHCFINFLDLYSSSPPSPRSRSDPFQLLRPPPTSTFTPSSILGLHLSTKAPTASHPIAQEP